MKVWLDKDSYAPFFYIKSEPAYGRAAVELDPEILELYRIVTEELDELTRIIEKAWNRAQNGDDHKTPSESNFVDK